MGLENKFTFHKVPSDNLTAEILTPEALQFVATLVQEFAAFQEYLVTEHRREQQARYNTGQNPGFLEAFLDEPLTIDDPSWKVAEHPHDLQRRWVEITGPASNRKMVINALNSGADCYMADFEDSEVPTWKNLMNGQKNLKDAVDKRISFKDHRGKEYQMKDKTATLLVRPRGLHLPEKHLLFENRPIPGSLFDFALYFFHNAKKLIEQGSGPYFYLPKLESNLEAKLWNDVFNQAQDTLQIPRGTIRATVLIETLPAAFEMEDILYQLKDHASGLNCGRWDYIFSYIKKLNQHQDKIFPDRDQVTMTQPFLKSYVDLLIQTCHQRGAYALGGMAAQIPLKDPEENQKAMQKVRTDKEREVAAGHDGTWVAHPGLVPLAREIFEKGMAGKYNQLDNLRAEVKVTEEDLLRVPEGTITYDNGLKKNIMVGIEYTEAWLKGIGCVPLYGVMEDAATADISRSQVWQWLYHRALLDDGRRVTPQLVAETTQEIIKERIAKMGVSYADSKFPEACTLFLQMIENHPFQDFLTLPAYDHLIREEK